jgi:hypothetical protein
LVLKHVQVLIFIACNTIVYVLDYFTTSYALINKLGHEANPLHIATPEGVTPWIWALTFPVQACLFLVSANRVYDWAQRNRGRVFGSDIWSLIFRNKIRKEIQDQPPKNWIMLYAGLVGFLLLHATVAVNNVCVIGLSGSCLFLSTDFGFQFSYMIGMIPAWVVSTALALLVTAFSIQYMLEVQGRQSSGS